jgi:hypothetical protein
LTVGQPLASHALDRSFGAIDVAKANRKAMIVAKIMRGEKAMQILLFATLTNALHAAFED